MDPLARSKEYRLPLRAVTGALKFIPDSVAEGELRGQLEIVLRVGGPIIEAVVLDGVRIETSYCRGKT